MVDFSASILDRREPLGLRGKAIVRGGKRLTRPSPKLFANAPDRVKSANTRNGTECCCGEPTCPDPCTSNDCQYCTGNSQLTALDLNYAVEVWAPVSGAPIFPPGCANASGACPGHPPDCTALDPAASYERSNFGEVGTNIVVHDWHLAQPAPMASCGTFSGTINLRNRQSGVRRTPFDQPPCNIIVSPVDVSGDHSFSFIRRNEGWELFSASGGTDFRYFDGPSNPCSGSANCTANQCNAQAVLDDLICALLPLECEVGEVNADSGCVQTIAAGGVTKCEKSRARIHLHWNIEK